MNKACSFTLTIMLVVIAPLAWANQVAPGNHFHITLPNKWIEIPNEVIEGYKQQLYEATGRMPVTDYGFQSPGKEDWMEYPFATATIKRTGRVPEAHLKNMKQVHSIMDKDLKEAGKLRKEYLSNLSLGETVYDADRHIVWSSFATDLKGVGKVKGVSAVVLTSYGAIQFVGYSFAKDYPHNHAIYKKMVHSIKLKKSDKY